MESNETKERSNPAPAPFSGDDLPPRLRGRVKALVHDLSRNDLPMALLDLAHLYRALAKKPDRDAAQYASSAPERADDQVHALIYNDDRSVIEEICDGPDERGGCPHAKAGHPAVCADKWISANGWDFKVAPGADGCPLVALGIVRRYLQATVADEARERGKDSDAD
jgi:hypothetical protein